MFDVDRNACSRLKACSKNTKLGQEFWLKHATHVSIDQVNGLVICHTRPFIRATASTWLQFHRLRFSSLQTCADLHKQTRQPDRCSKTTYSALNDVRRPVPTCINHPATTDFSPCSIFSWLLMTSGWSGQTARRKGIFLSGAKWPVKRCLAQLYPMA